MTIQRCLFFAILIFVVACSSSPKTEKSIAPLKTKPPSDFSDHKATALTKDGFSEEPSFSPDGSKILYTSGGRSFHASHQIYEMDLKTQKERRITHQIGDTSSPVYHPDGKRFFYSSTTDEIKEEYLNPSSYGTNELQRTEIYFSFLDGSEIERLTKNKGYDGDPTIHPNGNTLIFVSDRGGGEHLFSMDLKSRAIKALTRGEGRSSHPKYSRDGTLWTWSEQPTGAPMAHLMLQFGRKAITLTQYSGFHTEPSWLPDDKGIIFSSNQDEPENFEIYLVKQDGSCLKRLTYSAGDDTQPIVSPDGNTIIFTSNRTGLKQIYSMPLVLPTDCWTNTK